MNHSSPLGSLSIIDYWLVVEPPLWKMSLSMFVSWDDDIPNIWKVIKFHGASHHQPVHIFDWWWWTRSKGIKSTCFDVFCMMKLPSSKLTVRPWQSSGLKDEFPLKIGDKIRVQLLIYQRVTIKNADFPMKNGDFPMTNGDFPMTNADFPMKNADFPMKLSSLANLPRLSKMSVGSAAEPRGVSTEYGCESGWHGLQNAWEMWEVAGNWY